MASLSCPSSVNYNQAANCNFSILSNFGAYTINIDYGDGNNEDNNVTDGTIPITHTYTSYNDYIVTVMIYLTGATYSQTIQVNSGERIRLLEI